MVEEEREIDVEQDEDLGSDRMNSNMPENKRALHNAMERKRRDSIKDSFKGLQDCIPSLKGDKTSRAQVLKKTGDYISLMQQKIAKHQEEIQELKNQNQQLESQIRALEKVKSIGGVSGAQLSTSAIASLAGQLDVDQRGEVIYEDSSSDNSETTHTFNKINIVSAGGLLKTVNGVTRAPNSTISLATPGVSLVSSAGGSSSGSLVASTNTITIAPGQSLLASNIKVQPGQSLLLSEPLRKKKKLQ